MNGRLLATYISIILAALVLATCVSRDVLVGVGVAACAAAILGPGLTIAVFTGTDGVWNPAWHHQRYRISEYSARKPFFQWWYFSLKDYETGTTFAFCYSMSKTVNDPRNTGAYILFAAVGPGRRCHVYYKFPLERFEVAAGPVIKVGDDFSVSVMEGGNQGLKLKVAGRMANPRDAWVAEGIGRDAEVSWNLEVNRIAGWYGQQDIEPMTRALGMISWNTYAYDSEVLGSVTVDGARHEIARSPRFRMYCDMNWGERFPGALSEGKRHIDYPWGWYYMGIPDRDPARDLSIIAGVGRSQSSSKLLGVMNAKFASVYLRGARFSARSGRIADARPDKGAQWFSTAKDGRCKVFSVDRSSWATFHDTFGTAEIPLVQVVTIETTTLKVVLRFESKEENYNRLLFPTDGYVFSDFEALGVRCMAEIFRKSYRGRDIFKWRPAYKLMEKTVDNNAGLEYGYKIDLSI
ncbi:MAG: hypothetical protein JW839_18355 [Candidatus Lokiarchaeota archaeon]|nr:hypothetical protein [Candidatus Lokiarchaeota archaeon]